MTPMIYEILSGRTTITDVDTYLRDIADFSMDHDVQIQVLDAHMICGINHLESAIFHALRALDEKRMSTQSITMEVLLYASGERQITRAISKLGVKQGDIAVAVVFFETNETKTSLHNISKLFFKHFNVVKDMTVLQPSLNKLKRWGISDAEISIIEPAEYEDVILERVAMVDIIK